MEDFQDIKRRQIARMKSILDFGFGILFVVIGFYFIFKDSLKINFIQASSSGYDIMLGILFILYGAWRIYRGVKKNYFK